MVLSVVIIGAVMAAITIILGIILVKASSKNPYMAYLPGAIVFVAGVLLAISPTLTGTIEVMGAGLGGWGIAFLFASSIGFIITAIVDAYSSPVAN